MTVVFSLKTSANKGFTGSSCHDQTRHVLRAGTKMLSFSNLSRDLRKLEW
jgi:hypothetical protein